MSPHHVFRHQCTAQCVSEICCINRHQTVELLCSRTAACLRHCQIPLVWECETVSQKQQHHVCRARSVGFLRILHPSHSTSSSSAGLLLIWKRKFGTKSVTTPTAGTSGHQVCLNLQRAQICVCRNKQAEHPISCSRLSTATGDLCPLHPESG